MPGPLIEKHPRIPREVVFTVRGPAPKLYALTYSKKKTKSRRESFSRATGDEAIRASSRYKNFLRRTSRQTCRLVNAPSLL
jgi:hypothetical protein